MRQLIEIIKQQWILLIIAFMFMLAVYVNNDLFEEIEQLKIENSTKFNIHETMIIWSEGYKKAYDRINATEDYHFIDKDKFIADSLMMLRNLEQLNDTIIIWHATGSN